MPRRLPPLLLALLLPAVTAGAAGTALDPVARIPLDPATLGGAAIFTEAEQLVSAAATTAGLGFVPDPRPLPPQVVLTYDTPDGAAQKRGLLLFWRGDMLPDQLAPGEKGILIRKRRIPGGAWKTVQVRKDFVPAAASNLVPAARDPLPSMIIETPYQIGRLGDAPVTLVLWRAAEVDSAPLGGFIALPDPPAAMRDALLARAPPFPAQADWADRFDALSP